MGCSMFDTPVCSNSYQFLNSYFILLIFANAMTTLPLRLFHLMNPGLYFVSLAVRINQAGTHSEPSGEVRVIDIRKNLSSLPFFPMK